MIFSLALCLRCQKKVHFQCESIFSARRLPGAPDMRLSVLPEQER